MPTPLALEQRSWKPHHESFRPWSPSSVDDEASTLQPATSGAYLCTASPVFGLGAPAPTDASTTTLQSHLDASTLNLDNLKRALARVEQRCMNNTNLPFKHIHTLYNERMEVFLSTKNEMVDAGGLKRFAPLVLEPQTFSTGSPPPPVERVTRFHSAALPPIGFCDFVLHLTRHLVHSRPDNELLDDALFDVTTCSIVGAALVYMDRLDEALRRGAIRQGVTAHMAHRVFVAALSVANKMYGDENRWMSRALAEMCVISVLELGLLEAALLNPIDWNCCVAIVDLQAIFGQREDSER